jgi:peptidoglycan/xylan/chitin deacetylase (PgdA/CDA1 family)
MAVRKAGAAMAAALLIGMAAPRPALAEDACWSPAELKVKDGDVGIRRGAPEAHITIPAEPLAAFSPVAQRGVVRRVDLPAGSKLVALTFDLCEQPDEIAGYQGGIVDFLRDNDVKATFFTGGKWLLSHRARAQQLMADPRFELGNHTWEHRDLRILAGAALKDEVARAQAAFEAVRAGLDEEFAPHCTVPGGGTLAERAVPQRLSLFRFPFGACDAKSLAAVGELGLTAIQWDVSAGDPTPAQSAKQMVAGVVAAVRPGSIVLFHANGRGWHTEEALPAIVAQLKAKGFQFVTVSELMAAGRPVVAATCYDARPGDTDRYDGLARRLEGRYQRFLAKVPPGAQ